MAVYSNPKVHYTGPLPISNQNIPDPKKMNPRNLIDKNYYSFVEFPLQNIGSYCQLELPDSMVIHSVVCAGLGKTYISYNIRIRGFQIFAAKDTTEWSLLYEGENIDSSAKTISISSLEKWKYIRLTVTHEGQISSSVISELEAYGKIDSTIKIITGVTATTSSQPDGNNIATVKWQTGNMSTQDKVNILYRRKEDLSLIPIALNEENDGEYQWNISLQSNGEYIVVVEPAGNGGKYSLSASVLVENITNARIAINNDVYNDFTYDRTLNDHFSSVYFDDSIAIDWSFSASIKKQFHFRISYSIDSGKSWNPVMTVVDSAVRSIKIPVPRFHGFSLYSFFAVEIIVDSTALGRFVSDVPYPLVGSIDGLTKTAHYQSPVYSVTNASSLSSHPVAGKSYETLVFGPEWKSDISGNTILHWDKKYHSETAIGDINGDGNSDVIGILGPRNEQGNFLFIDTLGVYGSNTSMVSDVDNDGTDDVIYVRDSGFNLVYEAGSSFASFTFPGPTYPLRSEPVCADLDNDGKNELIFSMRRGNEVHAFGYLYEYLPGFPVLIDSIASVPVVADLFKSGNKNVILCNNQYILCLDHTGRYLPGFPKKIIGATAGGIVEHCIVADIDGDQFLDIIITTRKGNNAFTVYCFDRFGEMLPGWPVHIDDSYSFFGTRISQLPVGDPIIVIESRTKLGSFSPPYVVSMDGDSKNEIVLFNENGFMYVLTNTGVHKPGYPMFLGVGSANLKPHFGDFDGNGSLDVLFLIAKEYKHYIGNYSFGPGSYNPARMPWPTYRQNIARNPVAPEPMVTDARNDRHSPVITFRIFQNYPNPFNPSTTIPFSIPDAGMTRVTVYDVLGREIQTLVHEILGAGLHSAQFSAGSLNSGIYFIVLRHGGKSLNHKAVFIK